MGSQRSKGLNQEYMSRWNQSRVRMVYHTKHFNMTEFEPMQSEPDPGTEPFKNAGLLIFK